MAHNACLPLLLPCSSAEPSDVDKLLSLQDKLDRCDTERCAAKASVAGQHSAAAHRLRTACATCAAQHCRRPPAMPLLPLLPAGSPPRVSTPWWRSLKTPCCPCWACCSHTMQWTTAGQPPAPLRPQAAPAGTTGGCRCGSRPHLCARPPQIAQPWTSTSCWPRAQSCWAAPAQRGGRAPSRSRSMTAGRAGLSSSCGALPPCPPTAVPAARGTCRLRLRPLAAARPRPTYLPPPQTMRPPVWGHAAVLPAAAAAAAAGPPLRCGWLARRTTRG